MTPDEQKGLSDQVSSLVEVPNVGEDAKAAILGVYLIRVVGADVLETAVRALGDEIKRDRSPSELPSPAAPASEGSGPK